MIDVYKIIKNTKVEGPGSRFCIWVQGCSRHCKGCWAKETWAFGVGTKYSAEELFEMIKSEKNIEGVTFLGGEPFEQAEELSKLAKLVKGEKLSVVCFTGYTLENLKSKKNFYTEELIKYTDLLIDGEFQEENFDLTRAWVGSSNQRYHFLTDFYTPQILSKYANKIEARIDKNGKTEFNGMGDFKKLEKDLSYFASKPISAK